jgi:thioredoxin 1
MITVMRFTAPWCAPCKMLAPVIQGLAQEFPDVTFETVDVDGNPDMAQHFNIRSVPTVLVLNKDDAIIHTFVGVQPRQTYIDAIKTAQEM